MKKISSLFIIVLTTVFISGCTCVGTHVSKVEGGKKTTTGLFAFSAIDNGYPMLPFYSKFEAAE
jgi:uncharacterized protein YceK